MTDELKTLQPDATFEMYLPDKGEDANPVALSDGKSGLLVVSDGFGGSGGTHAKMPNTAETRARFIELAYPFADKESLGDLSKDREEGYWRKSVNEIFPDLEKGGEADHTNAFIASRIVVPNFVNLMKGKFIDDLTREFLDSVSLAIENCLKAVADEFHFTVKPGSMQFVLPATFAAILYEKPRYVIPGSKAGLNESRVAAIWAGDSRCYAFRKGDPHVFLLSEDDENDAGFVNNYFRVHDTLHCHLNCRIFDETNCTSKWLLDSNLVLFACSDGVFDPFKIESESSAGETVGVTTALCGGPVPAAKGNRYVGKLSTLKNKNLSLEEGMKQWKEMVLDAYRPPIQGDDVTIALAAVGFQSFNSIASNYTAKDVADLYKDLEEFGGKLRFAEDGPRKDALNYVEKKLTNNVALKDKRLTKLLSEQMYLETKDDPNRAPEDPALERLYVLLLDKAVPEKVEVDAVLVEEKKDEEPAKDDPMAIAREKYLRDLLKKAILSEVRDNGRVILRDPTKIVGLGRESALFPLLEALVEAKGKAPEEFEAALEAFLDGAIEKPDDRKFVFQAMVLSGIIATSNKDIPAEYLGTDAAEEEKKEEEPEKEMVEKLTPHSFALVLESYFPQLPAWIASGMKSHPEKTSCLDILFDANMLKDFRIAARIEIDAALRARVENAYQAFHLKEKSKDQMFAHSTIIPYEKAEEASK